MAIAVVLGGTFLFLILLCILDDVAREPIMLGVVALILVIAGVSAGRGIGALGDAIPHNPDPFNPWAVIPAQFIALSTVMKVRS